jgi:hypothetical protein
MISKGEDIDNLFSKKFEKFEAKPSESEWIELSSKLNRLNFLKFGFTTFNVYYLVTFVFLVTASTFSIVRNIQYAQEVKDLESKLKELQPKEQVIKSVGINKYLIEGDAQIHHDSAKVKVLQNADNFAGDSKTSKTSEAGPRQNHKTDPKDHKGFETDASQKPAIPAQKVETNIVPEKKDSATVSQSTLSGGSSSQTTIKKVKKVLVVKPKSVVLKRDTVIIKKDLK